MSLKTGISSEKYGDWLASFKFYKIFKGFFVTLILQGNHLVWFTKLSAL